MLVAVKYGALSSAPLVDENGALVTESGQATIALRLLRMFPGAVLVGRESGRAGDWEVRRLGQLDPENTLVINLDVLDSVGVFQRLHRDGAEPHIMNFQWVNPSSFHHPVNFAAMGLAYAFFPTFCSGQRTAAEVREVTERWTIPSLHNRARVAWADLGVRTDQVRERREEEVPVVMYPAISMTERKQPELFLSIVSAVQKQVPFTVRARLAESSLVSDHAIRLGAQRWSQVSPLRAREEYWDDLARTRAFVATSLEESYGLEYVEAMLAGVIGILPDLPWARRLVPEGYPFLYGSVAEAEHMLLKALTDPQHCRRQLDQLVGGSFTEWVSHTHDRTGFEVAFTKQVAAWFGPETLGH